MTTSAQLARIQKDYSLIAGESVTIEQIGGTLYAFGSEVATLRLFHKMPTMCHGFSANLGTFYFSVELSA